MLLRARTGRHTCLFVYAASFSFRASHRLPNRGASLLSMCLSCLVVVLVFRCLLSRVCLDDSPRSCTQSLCFTFFFPYCVVKPPAWGKQLKKKDRTIWRFPLSPLCEPLQQCTSRSHPLLSPLSALPLTPSHRCATRPSSPPPPAWCAGDENSVCASSVCYQDTQEVDAGERSALRTTDRMKPEATMHFHAVDRTRNQKMELTQPHVSSHCFGDLAPRRKLNKRKQPKCSEVRRECRRRSSKKKLSVSPLSQSR